MSHNMQQSPVLLSTKQRSKLQRTSLCQVTDRRSSPTIPVAVCLLAGEVVRVSC